MEIRPYGDADFGAVVALWDACGISAAHNDPARDIPFMQAAPNAALFVGCEGPNLVGTIMVGHDGHRGWLYKLAVAADRRGRGLGKALVRHAEGWLAAQGLRKAQLMVRDSNAAVKAFYARIGYGYQPRHVMARWLDAPQPAEAGKIGVVVTYLEMTEPPKRPAKPMPAGRYALLHAENPPVEFYRYLYDKVGEPWFWYERRAMDDATLSAILADPKVEVYVLYAAGVPAGYVEIDRRSTPDAGLAYFGLMPSFTGRGLGPALLDWAIESAWQDQPRRVTVDTCTLDHPKALQTYQRAGFVPYRQVAKQIDDPRLTGLIPAHREPRLPPAAGAG